jgi:hypothetical protein
MRSSVSLSCSRKDDRLARKRLVRVLITPEENATNILPGLSLGRQNLPWATTTLKKNLVPKPERGDLARGIARAKDATASISHDAGTSATVRTRNADERSAAGRRRGDRLNVVRPAPPKPSMPRQRRRAVGRPSSCPRMFKNRNLRRRVVTQQKFFALPLCDRPGCYEPPVISSRNPARFCCAACRQAVRNVLDRERKWLSRGRLDDQKKQAIEFGAACSDRSLPQQTTAADVPPRSPPQRR